jgi:hypothetical protein
MTPPTDPFARPARRVAVFGHPSHELAVYGLLKRHRPHVVVLTDGGRDVRREQSRRGLDAIGCLDRATYLPFSESSFYEALLDRDAAFFEDVADALAAVLRPLRPEQLFCDAVEFYNPVHDVTRPIVERAAASLGPCEVFEIPLVYQEPAADERYVVQRVPQAMSASRLRFSLTDDEADAKGRARDAIYSNLRDGLGPDLFAVPRPHFAIEEIAAATRLPDDPASTGRVLRYEWRANRLLAEGAIDRAITYRGHFLPVARALAAAAVPRT